MTTAITRIEKLFDAALDVPPDDRAGWLDSNCAGDEALRLRLEQLLAADATNSDGVLDEPVVSRASEEMPVRVGPFTPIRVIGEGGMGVVFEATQEGTGRSVATYDHGFEHGSTLWLDCAAPRIPGATAPVQRLGHRGRAWGALS